MGCVVCYRVFFPGNYITQNTPKMTRCERLADGQRYGGAQDDKTRCGNPFREKSTEKASER